jgi:hypothetical protein
MDIPSVCAFGLRGKRMRFAPRTALRADATMRQLPDLAPVLYRGFQRLPVTC